MRKALVFFWSCLSSIQMERWEGQLWREGWCTAVALKGGSRTCLGSGRQMNYGILHLLRFVKLQFVSGIGHIVSHSLSVIPKVDMNMQVGVCQEVCPVNKKSLFRHFFLYCFKNGSSLVFYLIRGDYLSRSSSATFENQKSNPKFNAGIAKHAVCLWLSSVTSQISITAFLLRTWITFLWRMKQWSYYRNGSPMKQFPENNL